MIHMHTATVKRKADRVQNSGVLTTPGDDDPHDGVPTSRRGRRGARPRDERGAEPRGAEPRGAEPRGAEPRGDGRRRRWEEHKRARRAEFVTAAIEAIRVNGTDVGLDDIAAQAGVSKPVLYRHFTDKADVFSAVLDRIATDVFLPLVGAALAQPKDDETLLRDAVSAYVGLVVSEPQLYQFVFTHNALGTQGDFVANMEDTIALGLSALMADRLRKEGVDSGGAETWAYGVVGMVQLAAHQWMKHRVISAEALVDYLIDLAWKGISGLVPRSETEEDAP
jgi:AcrR family transcriptional regulator